MDFKVNYSIQEEISPIQLHRIENFAGKIINISGKFNHDYFIYNVFNRFYNEKRTYVVFKNDMSGKHDHIEDGITCYLLELV